MNIAEIIRKYLKGLEEGNYHYVISLFSSEAVINSPLYGKLKAIDFYRELFKDTSESKITLLNILNGEKLNMAAGHFRYDWILRGGAKTSFECVDIFHFNENGKIKELTIIYDTSKIRNSFEEMKK